MPKGGIEIDDCAFVVLTHSWLERPAVLTEMQISSEQIDDLFSKLSEYV